MNHNPLKWNPIVQKEIVGIVAVSNGVSNWLTKSRRAETEDSDIHQLGIWKQEKEDKTNFEKRKMQGNGFFQRCNVWAFDCVKAVPQASWEGMKPVEDMKPMERQKIPNQCL